jgi:hypothetical protein
MTQRSRTLTRNPAVPLNAFGGSMDIDPPGLITIDHPHEGTIPECPSFRALTPMTAHAFVRSASCVRGRMTHVPIRVNQSDRSIADRTRVALPLFTGGLNGPAAKIRIASTIRRCGALVGGPLGSTPFRLASGGENACNELGEPVNGLPVVVNH